MEENQNINQPVQNPNPIPSPAATPPIPETPKPKPKLPLLLLVILLILFLTGGVGAAYMLVLQPKPQPEPKEERKVSETIPSPTPDPTASWKTYVNTKYNYSFKYPPLLRHLILPGPDQPTEAEFAEFRNVTIATHNNDENRPPEIYNNDWMEISVHAYPEDSDLNQIRCQNSTVCIEKLISDWNTRIPKTGDVKRKHNGVELPGYYNNTDNTGLYVKNLKQTRITELYPILQDGNLFVLELDILVQDEDEQKYMSAIFDQILSTFKFTAPVASASPQPSQTDNPNNNKRKTDVTRIVNAIGAYTADNKGTLPNEITLNSQIISKGGADLCSKLVPQYISALPVDPLTNNGEAITDCSGNYFTNYSINKNPENTITVSAPAAELGEIIWLTR